MDTTKYLHDPHAAALSRAAAIRALHSYRSARSRAEDRGADMALLIEPPSYEKLGEEYVRLVEEIIDQRIAGANVARSAIDLLAGILSDQQLGGILDEGAVASIEKDQADALRLVACLSGWVNNVDIADAIREERAKAGLAPHPPMDRVDKAELRRRVAAIVAEFGAVPEANDSGIIEAGRRLVGMRAATRQLSKALPWDIATEEEIIEPVLTAAENALVDLVEDTPAESLHAAAVKLREAIVAAAPNDASTLRQVLTVIEHEAGMEARQ